MEGKLIKMAVKLGLLVLLIWAVASFVVAHSDQGAKDDQGDKCKRGGDHRRSKGDRWATGIVQGEKCEPGAVQPAPLARMQAA